MEQDEMLKKYISNELSEAEINQFKQTTAYKEYMALLDYAPAFKSPQFNAKVNFTKIQQQVNKRKINRGKIVSIGVISTIAALLVFGVFVLADYFTHSEHYHTAIAGQTELTLPDDSNVVLSANSSLLLDNKTWLNNRSLKLKGEAFFEVQKGKVFVVNTRMGNVSVLGTDFNVKHRNKLFEVSCFSGKVQVDTGGQSYIIEAGERIQNYDGKISSFKLNETQPTWKEGFSSFKGVAVSQVISELQHHYDVEIKFGGIAKETKFSGSFEHGDLENALTSICAPLSLEFEVFENKVIIYKP
ncbi:MAG: FecR family protein [Flavobacteriaceae bacterium]|nr:FecR family protein [Flavobacteriaceae bacterium]